MGWLTYDVPVGDPRFGKLVRCSHCGEDKHREHLLALSGLPEEARAYNWKNTVRTAANARAYDVAQKLAAAPCGFYTLLSPGHYGVGKTRLLATIANQARLAGYTAIYTTTADVLDHLRDAFSDGAGDGPNERLEALRTCCVLCLDEFDRWNPTPWAQEKFFQLINHRYENRDRMLTAFAANVAAGDLPAYVASRMLDTTNYLFTMTGQDVRRIRRT